MNVRDKKQHAFSADVGHYLCEEVGTTTGGRFENLGHPTFQEMYAKVAVVLRQQRWFSSIKIRLCPGHIITNYLSLPTIYGPQDRYISIIVPPNACSQYRSLQKSGFWLPKHGIIWWPSETSRVLPKTKYNLVVANPVDFTEDHFVSGLKIYEIYVFYHHSLLGKGNAVFFTFYRAFFWCSSGAHYYSDCAVHKL